MHAAQSCSTLIEHTPTHKNAFFLPVNGISISVKTKTSHIKHQVLTCLKTCCQSQKKFERKIDWISACEIISNFMKHPVYAYMHMCMYVFIYIYIGIERG